MATKRAAATAGSSRRGRASGGAAMAAKGAAAGRRGGTVRKSVGGKKAGARATTRTKSGAESESMIAGLGSKAMEAAKTLVEKGAELIEQIKPGKKAARSRSRKRK
jgi:hypothetical protein